MKTQPIPSKKHDTLFLSPATTELESSKSSPTKTPSIQLSPQQIIDEAKTKVQEALRNLQALQETRGGPLTPATPKPDSASAIKVQSGGTAAAVGLQTRTPPLELNPKSGAATAAQLLDLETHSSSSEKMSPRTQSSPNQQTRTDRTATLQSSPVQSRPANWDSMTDSAKRQWKKRHQK